MRGAGVVTLRDPKSPVSEAYRIARTNLQFTSIDKEVKAIVVTSAGPGEGKSTTSVNMAITFAQAEKKVLLIDCDLRKSSIHKYLYLSNKDGLTNVLAGMASLENVIMDSSVEGLQVVTAGPVPPNPAELLNSQTMRNVLKQVKEEYDYVILDSPPAVAVTDGAILSTMADGTILVVEAGKTPIEVAQRAKDNLVQVNANILGVMLNKIEVKDEQYYYYYGEEKSKTVRKKAEGKQRKKLFSRPSFTE